ncbi:uncharacterized protein TrAtP1_001923 [Trichoderma atroviride]|uniref:uncharacterized protein n=1 Tax=Hypocrea atroviridis TaxID=63577 RepID=UPI0033315551|nr:hypothetical protein TrAtP1_001923 [Trichoderma atroviride]
MPAAQYAIAWIATSEAAFNGALQVLNPDQENHVWRVDTPRDIVSNVPTPPTRYPYNHGVVNGQMVYLANALHEDFTSLLAEIMVSKLARKRIQVRMILVSSLSYVENYAASSLGPNHCVLDTFPPPRYHWHRFS